MLVACGQTLWPSGTSDDQVLTEISRAGYAGAPAVPREGNTADEIIRLYAQHWLFPAPGQFSADYWRSDQSDKILLATRRQARFARDVGCTEMSLLAGGFAGYIGLRGRRRSDLVGRITAQDGLDPAERRRTAELLNRIGETTLRDGVHSCLGNHAGTLVESADEIERLLASTDPALVYLSPDTGHLTWAGIDPVDFCRRHMERIKTIYLSDVNPDVLRQGLVRGWDYDGFVNNGLFVELGRGCVDFPALFSVLCEAEFAGWVIVRSSSIRWATASESAAASREYLFSIGV
jgi:inosose dehydratase